MHSYWTMILTRSKQYHNIIFDLNMVWFSDLSISFNLFTTGCKGRYWTNQVLQLGTTAVPQIQTLDPGANFSGSWMIFAEWITFQQQCQSFAQSTAASTSSIITMSPNRGRLSNRRLPNQSNASSAKVRNHLSSSSPRQAPLIRSDSQDSDHDSNSGTRRKHTGGPAGESMKDYLPEQLQSHEDSLQKLEDCMQKYTFGTLMCKPATKEEITSHENLINVIKNGFTETHWRDIIERAVKSAVVPINENKCGKGAYMFKKKRGVWKCESPFGRSFALEY